jgi:hypothetical protein
MSKSNARLIAVNLKAGNVKLAVLIALMDNIEYGNVANLSNAYGAVREHVTPVEWRSALAQLAKDGKYAAWESADFRGDYGYILK